MMTIKKNPLLLQIEIMYNNFSRVVFSVKT